MAGDMGEAVRLAESGQRIAEAARSLGVVEQTLSNWVKVNHSGGLATIRSGWSVRAYLRSSEMGRAAFLGWFSVFVE
jgi:transposase-like protein